MGFENFANRINSLRNFNIFEKPPADYKEVSRFTVLDREMQKKTVTKRKFPQINDKRFYFAAEITSLSLCHANLKELAKLKRKMGQRIERYFWHEKENLLKTDNKAKELNERLLLYHQVLMNELQIFLLNQKENFVSEDKIPNNIKRNEFRQKMANVEYCYDGKFEGNILVVGQTGCRKTTFIQNIAKIDLFGESKEIFWISKISFSTEREDIKSCFKKYLDFKYSQNLHNFKHGIRLFSEKKRRE